MRKGKTFESFIYVIRLEKSKFSDVDNRKFSKKNPDYKKGSPCVYVGMTMRHPDYRMKEHKDTEIKFKKKDKKEHHKSSHWVRKYGEDDFEKNLPLKGFEKGYRKSTRSINKARQKIYKKGFINMSQEEKKKIKSFEGRFRRKTEHWEKFNAENLRKIGWGVVGS